MIIMMALFSISTTWLFICKIHVLQNTCASKYICFKIHLLQNTSASKYICFKIYLPKKFKEVISSKNEIHLKYIC